MLALALALAAGLISLASAAEASASGDCLRLVNPDALSAPGCKRIFNDTATRADPKPKWGSIDCQRRRRHRRITGGADAMLSASGEAQGNDSYRRLTVRNGDDFFGERCELGRNHTGYGGMRPASVLYREGQRRATFASFRLTKSFPLRTKFWQLVLQMKQTQPSANGGGTPVLALEAYNGRWRLRQSISKRYAKRSRQLWSAPARKLTWTRFAFDITYSQDPSVGSVKVHVDLNGDGDSNDFREQSPTIRTYTLKREIKGGSRDGIPPGKSIPSHLRAGIYHKRKIRCPRRTGCAVAMDNVQVVKPG